jgi:hypothetical protein
VVLGLSEAAPWRSWTKGALVGVRGPQCEQSEGSLLTPFFWAWRSMCECAGEHECIGV